MLRFFGNDYFFLTITFMNCIVCVTTDHCFIKISFNFFTKTYYYILKVKTADLFLLI